MLFSRVINNKINALGTRFGGSEATVGRYVNALASDKTIIDAFTGINKALTEEQIRNNLRLMLQGFSSSSQLKTSAHILSGVPSAQNTSLRFSTDIIPEVFRKAFAGAGNDRTIDSKEISRRLSTGAQAVNSDVYKMLRNYVERENEGSYLINALREAKIADVVNGRLRWANHLSRTQASYLSGLSLRSAFDARRGYAYYDANPNDPAVDEKMIRRNSGEFRANVGLL